MDHAGAGARSFRLKEGAEEAFVRERPQVVAELRRTCPGLVAAYLTKLDDRLWLDAVLWESRELAEAAAVKVHDSPLLAEWFSNIEEVVAFEQADVVHAA